MVHEWEDKYQLSPALPDAEDMDDLRGLATDVRDGSLALEATLAPATAKAIGAKVRVINSHFSNSIEGLATTYRQIEEEIERERSGKPRRMAPKGTPISDEQYAHEVARAHVLVEEQLMDLVLNHGGNVSTPEFVSLIHKSIFSQLPPEHQFTHERGHFTDIPVTPGIFRDGPIHVGNKDYSDQIGPSTKQDLEACMQAFGRIYDPATFKGGEAQMIAAAASHVKLGWLHPFRDGNGRTIRLHSTLFMARCGVNRANLWSLSRGLSQRRGRYFSFLSAGNPQPMDENRDKITFQSDNTAMFCQGFLTIAKEQVDFMKDQLRLRSVSERIDAFAATELKAQFGIRSMDAGRLLRVVFQNGQLERQQAYEVLGSLKLRTAQTIVSGLVQDGYLESQSHKSPLTIGLPAKAMSAYFPDLCIPSVMGKDTPKAKELLSKSAKAGRERDPDFGL